MQIVIDIPEDVFSDIKKTYMGDNVVYCEIKNGTPLPANHGRLIDADEVKYVVEIFKDQYDGIHELPKQIDTLPTIIEADKEAAEHDEPRNDNRSPE